jgi:hypothetical protein
VHEIFPVNPKTFRELMEMKFDIIADQIRKLGGLRDEGLLTEEEFAGKKAELLDRL